MSSFESNYNNDNFSFNFDDSQNYFSDNADENKKSFKLYNFRRPDKFSKEHLRGLQDIHREFSRQLSLNLSTYLSMPIEIDVVSVDQLTYDEFVRSMPTPVTIAILELPPLPGQVLMGMGFEVLSAIVDRMLGGIGSCEDINRELTDIEEALAKRLFERTLRNLEQAWSKIIPVSGTIRDLDNDYNKIQIATPGEIVALITFEIQVSGKYFGLMSFCFTFPFLENILTQLTTQHIFQSQGFIANSDEQKQMIKQLNTTTAPIEVIFGKCKISTKDFLSLKEGDILRLDEKITDDLIVSVSGKKKFFARPGRIKNKVCVKVTDTYDENVTIFREY